MPPFRPRKTFERELRGQPEFKTRMRATTTLLAIVIKAAAPRGTGAKAGGFKRRVRPRGYRVVLGDEFWHLVEYGSANNPPYAPVRRGTRELGLRFENAGTEHMPGIS